jgi:CRISPR-associated protein Cmr3
MPRHVAQTLFLEPIDVLYLRGNKSFGAAGDHGESLMPPWPSLAAGAIRSRLMAEGETLESLAPFRLTRFGLARQTNDGEVEALWPLPADVFVTQDDSSTPPKLSNPAYLRPTAPPAGIASSHALPLLPALCAAKPGKPVNGLWLNGPGIAAWLAGQPIRPAHLLRSSELWQTDPRLGIALDPTTRRAADKKIYTTETVALRKKVGFIASSSGHQRRLADGDLVRLGGDGRAAKVSRVSAALPLTDWARIEREGRFRLILTSPGIFPAGWQPAGVPGDLLAASVSRAETISGWDLLTGKPKPAQRIAPTGSVYWYACRDKLADLAPLKFLVDNGLPIDDPTRRAEGFNHCHVAPWAEEN